MNTAIYATILTGLGVVITLIVTMFNLAKIFQQVTNRRIADTNRRIDEMRQDVLAAIENKSKVTDARSRWSTSGFKSWKRTSPKSARKCRTSGK